MEKVGILTHSVAYNYGANLQALSTACYLRNHGYQPVFLRWDSYLTGSTPSSQVDIHHSFLKKLGFTISDPLINDEDFSNFISNECLNRVIVGSDCVLTYEHHRIPFTITRKGIVRIKSSEDYKFPNPFWLPFLSSNTNICRCLLSASTGGRSSLKIKDSVVKFRMQELLNMFDYISVRDTFTQKFLDNLLPDRRDIELTPDPVFGFNNNVSFIPTEEETREKFKIAGKYYLISFYKSNWPNQEWANKLMNEAHKNSVQCISLPMPQGGRNSNFDIDIELPLDPLDWYALIRYSDAYIGNNMHPIIVAIHNNVPFFCYNIHGRNLLHGRIQLIKTSKEYDLLKRFGLQNNLVPQPFLPFISPKKIVKSINEFDYKKCKKASDQLQADYEKMMSQILKKLEVF